MSQQEQILILSWLIPMLNGNLNTAVGIFPDKYRGYVVSTALLHNYVSVIGYNCKGWLQVTFVKFSPPC